MRGGPQSRLNSKKLTPFSMLSQPPGDDHRYFMSCHSLHDWTPSHSDWFDIDMQKGGNKSEFAMYFTNIAVVT